ncbi:zinc-binding dehydrogenase [Ornithinimicrobium ciconiae]|uniref:Zinc-binding dehydrogenase n=1 Tax=Ornithinimicrobium ciconiae TaxID=2594265 RepID=A0A516G7A1_9MICO|nr:alcohol dehydrogenase catalytic domain-containing protein [Ornithinimicrobium ciconiae]QDO87352.1 zinc-binding dehydrogenase [Ornithinimicrobium ciconiae]
MRTVTFNAFGELPSVTDVPVPPAPDGGVVVEVRATGLCRSDWHGWAGHDTDITVLPHTPGHEFAGVIHAVGAGVERVVPGQRVTFPFALGCGQCRVCRAGASHVCPDQWQPGVNGPGSFADYVALPWADFNVVALPDSVSFAVAAGLGCRFATAYRAVVDVGQVRARETVTVFGCGGVGLAAVMIAHSRGAEVIAIDVDRGALDLATSLGAGSVLDAGNGDVAERVRELTEGGADVAVEALGSVVTAEAAIRSLAIRGRHLQIGLLPPAVVGDRATVPMHTVIARELQVLGSHGMPARDYPRMLADIASGRLAPERLLGRTITLEEAPAALAAMDSASTPGVTIIEP